MTPKSHWENVYQTKSPTDVSWYQQLPALSLKLIRSTGAAKGDGIIDVGGGASLLVDCLLSDGYEKVAVLDISASALQHAKARLAQRASGVEWYEADVMTFRPPHRFAVWHDRAVLHFLTGAVDRRKYVSVVKKTLIPNGHLIIAAFAVNGPPQCSGLDVIRYDARRLCSELGDDFALLETHDEAHTTPWGTEQKFIYCRFQRGSRV